MSASAQPALSAVSSGAVTLYVGGSRVPGLDGERCHSAITPARTCDVMPAKKVLLDSGAFSDKPHDRLSFAGALDRQVAWETHAAGMCHMPAFKLEIIASYDYLLIDEVWENGARRKQRWQAGAGWNAVQVSIDAAAYLATHRDTLNPRKLLFGCQGVTAEQYIACAQGILEISQPEDWFGFGGRCILGRRKSLLQEHYETASTIVPMVAARGLSHIHIFGVLYEPAIAPLAWLCNHHGIELSTDSAAPVLTVTRRDHKRSGVRVPTVLGNVAWWRNHLANIHLSKWYRNPNTLIHAKQMSLFEVAS